MQQKENEEWVQVERSNQECTVKSFQIYSFKRIQAFQVNSISSIHCPFQSIWRRELTVMSCHILRIWRTICRWCYKLQRKEHYGERTYIHTQHTCFNKCTFVFLQLCAWVYMSSLSLLLINIAEEIRFRQIFTLLDKICI